MKKEKLESQTIDYWSFIYKNPTEETYHLWLVDKNKVKLSDFKEEIKKLTKHNSNRNFFMFHSFKRRALYKLCFAEESSFVKDMPKDF